MPVSDYTPSIEDVGARLFSRTKTKGGQEAGTFNPSTAEERDKTRPTAEQVMALISENVDTIAGEFGADIPDAPGDDPARFRKGVKSLVTLAVAMDVELNFYAEQVATGRSPYRDMKTLFDSRHKALLGAIFPGDGDGGPGGPQTEGEGYASYGGFPWNGLGMDQPL